MKDKIKEKNIWINKVKLEYIIMFIAIIIAVSIFTFYVKIGVNDELWNFSNIYKMTNGEIIYKDCNVIVTPLFFYLGQLLFTLLNPNYLTFRIYNLIIYTILYFLEYIIFRKFKIPKEQSVLFLIISFGITGTMILIGANYNVLAIVFILLGILSNLKKEKHKYNNIIQGIIIFLVFMTKQTIGILYLIGVITYNIITIDSIKEKIKVNLKQILVFFAFIGVYIIYLATNNNLYNFINYTILGLFDFSRNTNFDNYIIIFAIEIIINIFVLLIALFKRNKAEKIIMNNVILLSIFSIMLLINAYPIFNKAHIILYSFIFIILIEYLIKIIFLDKFKNLKNINIIINIINVIALCIIIVFSICMNYLYITNLNKKYEPYYGGIIENSEQIDSVVDYIVSEKENGIDVKFISCDANLYNNILKINNGRIDLPFYGNLGENGINSLIEEIRKMENTNILISKEGLKYQEVEEIIEFVKNNYSIIGEINNYYIYRIEN